MGKTPPKEKEKEGSPRKKAARVVSAAGASAPRKKSPRRLGKSPAMAVPLATVPELSELVVEARPKGASVEKRCKCNHVITESAMEDLVPPITSEAAWACFECWNEDMEGIVKARPAKSDLLICVKCYDHLCCGVGSVAYPFGHSRAHALKEKHWFAFLYCDPGRGYCFRCNAEARVPVPVPKKKEVRVSVPVPVPVPPKKKVRVRVPVPVPVPVKSRKGGNEVGVQVAGDFISQLQADVNPKVKMVGKVQPEIRPSLFGVDLVKIMGKVQAEFCPSLFGVDLADKWPSYGSRSSDAQGYAIKGIPNLGNTCYMSAVLQCLLVLGKLRERMLALVLDDCPRGLLPELIQELFVEASASGDVLDPTKVVTCVACCKRPNFQIGTMEDSHELFIVLCSIWDFGERVYNRQSVSPTVIDSIFRFVMVQTLSCKRCGHSSGHDPDVYWGLLVKFPLKWHQTKSAASPQTIESPRSRKREIANQLFPAYVQRNLEKMQTVSGSGYSHAIGSEVTVEETYKPLEVDSPQPQRISQSKDVVQSPLQIQKGKSVDSLTADSISIEDLLLHFSEVQIAWPCPNCAKDHEEPSASQRKNVGDTVQFTRFTMLPPVLTLHLGRTSIFGHKISCHVRFMEYLDVERFMDPSYVDKGSTLYRLAGVVVHIGEGSLKSGHYIAYVRARRLGNQQEGSSCSSSWFCADDSHIRQVTLEKVLNSEAYMLFYERMEDQDISGIRRQN